LSAYHRERLVQGFDDVIGADNIGQAMTVKIGLQGRLRVYEHATPITTTAAVANTSRNSPALSRRMLRKPRSSTSPTAIVKMMAPRTHCGR
jgi:hypothetical protein